MFLILLFVIEYANDTDNIGRKQPPVRISWKFYKGGVPGTDAPKMQALPKLG